jgi:hypothetical protein
VSSDARKKAIEAVRRLIQSRPDDKAIWQYLHTWTSDPGDDRAKGLLATAMLEHALEEAILVFFEGRDPNFFKDQENGASSTFHIKIRLALALGIIETTVKQDLDTIKVIRNAFAHAVEDIVFDTKEIKEACGTLMIPQRIHWGGLLGASPLGDAKMTFASTIRLLYTYFISHKPNLLMMEKPKKLSWEDHDLYCLLFLRKAPRVGLKIEDGD